ncbi:MAG TPA: acetylglucosamine-6-sulfatase [Solibacterales bacterium]|nr:acetylglucosamine-6-sulfatase [Bryobacterales bacterium]
MTPHSRRTFLQSAAAATLAGATLAGTPRPRNVIFILTDDQRYDAFGFMHPQPWLRTPNMDSLARDGAHLKNAFVTTALCSPSRASILTGVYAHRHQIVDNNTRIPPGTRFFPELLQKAGYKTAFMGKWHMGNSGDQPQPGFDKWVSFRGQGSYLPNPAGLNVDGKHVAQKGYITDELTDYALDWLNQIPREQPYFLYLSHKAVHADFIPAQRHKGVYAKETFHPPKTMAESGEYAQHRPMWVRNQRNSWHGVDFPYHSDLNIGEYYKRYAETLLAVDDSVGRVLDALRKRGDLDSTLILYMGDNGFAFGEHGLIDKRTAYEESMRVPMLARCPELFPGGKVIESMVAGLDIMPTVLDAARAAIPNDLDGRSMLPLLTGKTDPQWRQELLYEYYWERNFPQTPTMHALRTDRYKYIHYYGIWDLDELYDLQEDPLETNNLISNPERKDTVKVLNQRLFDSMEATGGMKIPLYRDSGKQNNKRDPAKGRSADFPDELKMRRP